jgi:hypothetical protein
MTMPFSPEVSCPDTRSSDVDATYITKLYVMQMRTRGIRTCPTRQQPGANAGHGKGLRACESNSSWLNRTRLPF